jgi:hypothetical protein
MFATRTRRAQKATKVSGCFLSGFLCSLCIRGQRPETHQQKKNQMSRQFFVFMLWQIASASCFAQVSNNSIHNRISLNLDDGWHTSSTTNSNVEWDCINKALTNKCLVYHNDQWFTIKPSGPGPLFLNVSNQVCGKQFGVQMVIIEGDPCKAGSYRLKKCIPFTDQSDFFVKLDSLDASQEYLINIDGYLGDRCKFEIAYSTFSEGIPVDAPNLDNVNFSLLQKDSLVTLQWQTHDSLSFSVSTFHVYRKKKNDRRAIRVTIPMEHNAYGAARKNYQISDTLRQDGEYIYSIYGSRANDRVLLGREKIIYKASVKSPARQSYITPLEYLVDNSGIVSVSVMEEGSGNQLFSGKQKAVQGRNTVLLNLASFVAQGILDYKVIITEGKIRREYSISFQSRE